MKTTDYCINYSNCGIGCNSKLDSIPPWERDEYDKFEDNCADCLSVFDCRDCHKNKEKKHENSKTINERPIN